MRRAGSWRLCVRAGDPWPDDTWMRVARAVRAGAPVHVSKHATTHHCAGEGRDVYLKTYRTYGWRTALKDLARSSKARHVQHVSGRLAAAGFVVPEVLAVAECRRGPVVVRAWVATAALPGVPLATCLADVRRGLGAKRATLAAVGREVARLHEAGFVAGDLVPSNVWIDGDRVAFLDHDRTAEGRWAAVWWRARRNLVQLNRFVLSGVTVTDRLRVYRAYTATRGWSAREARRRLGWVVRKTMQRRRRFDGAAPAGFRELMRAPSERPTP